jgi:2-polyprenyl-3-methyl-5-hydroxy-6-metoxy-1,4-benzoquinol methylase
MKTINAMIVQFTKKCPPIYHHAQFLHRMLFDPPSIKTKWYWEIKKTQLDKHSPLFLDRQNEIKAFFKIDSFHLLKHYLKYGLPNTDRFKEHYIEAFRNNTGPDRLKNAYDSVSFDYALRLMLAYERYSMITDYLDFMVRDRQRNLGNFRVLDYGCGVSDIGLLFASFGADVTICDLDNKRFDFTVWRFRSRGFNVKPIRITDTEVYPESPESEFDLVVATELFEHVRDPLKLLTNFTKCLKSGGYLFDSMGGTFERDDRPHHLSEALNIGNSEEYKQYYEEHYLHLDPGGGLTYLFKKRL